MPLDQLTDADRLLVCFYLPHPLPSDPTLAEWCRRHWQYEADLRAFVVFLRAYRSAAARRPVQVIDDPEHATDTLAECEAHIPPPHMLSDASLKAQETCLTEQDIALSREAAKTYARFARITAEAALASAESSTR